MASNSAVTLKVREVEIFSVMPSRCFFCFFCKLSLKFRGVNVVKIGPNEAYMFIVLPLKLLPPCRGRSKIGRNLQACRRGGLFFG